MYLWIKAFHVIAVISWMAGMLYLPRLFVYHAAVAPLSAQSETFKVMERRLLRYIMTPAMIVTWVLGLILVLESGVFGAGWFRLKFLLVVAVTVMHGQFSHWTRDFAYNRNRRSQRFYRVVNEIPTILMVAIVILVVVKPF